MRLKVTVLPGDGIGPEVTAQAVRVLETIAGISGLHVRIHGTPRRWGCDSRLWFTTAAHNARRVPGKRCGSSSAPSDHLNMIACRLTSDLKPVVVT
jgi:hypothetical protein